MRKIYVAIEIIIIAIVLFSCASKNEALESTTRKVYDLENTIARKEADLLGYTKYTDFVTLGQKAMSEHVKLMTATIKREEGVTQVIEKSVLGLSSHATIAMWFTAEYAFGFDLRPDAYEVQATPAGLEVRVKKPILLTTPAVTNLRHKVLSGGLFTDEKAATLKLYESAAKQAQVQGTKLLADEAVLALCEKKLISFMRDFLGKQPGVKAIPGIVVVYR